ncbi:MAG TPA: alanine--glyoxylate aminotransferase family protein [Planctomycetota bacterium]|nr:alanine--glyoxylate aminotransferase family protein [Planctomycetota bacterium]
MTRRKLFIPGPTEVRPEILAAMATPLIGHRGAECRDLVRRIVEKLRPVFGTQGLALFETCPATALMEASMRNLVHERALVLTCGAFSERWHEIALACGKEADALPVEWGKPNRADELGEVLRSRRYDVVTITHNETSTGVLNPLRELAAVARKHDCLVLVDAVSSLGGAPIDFDANGLDFCFAGTQKCLAVPPGLTVFALSTRAVERAARQKHRGWMFDFVRAAKSFEKFETLATPSLSHLFALDAQLDAILKETLPARFARHRAMAERVWSWAEERGLEMFSEAGFRSPSISCIRLGPHAPETLANRAKAAGFVLGDGYGQAKTTTFRIGHMGDHDLASVGALLAALDG